MFMKNTIVALAVLIAASNAASVVEHTRDVTGTNVLPNTGVNQQTLNRRDDIEAAADTDGYVENSQYYPGSYDSGYYNQESYGGYGGGYAGGSYAEPYEGYDDTYRRYETDLEREREWREYEEHQRQQQQGRYGGGYHEEEEDDCDDEEDSHDSGYHHGGYYDEGYSGHSGRYGHGGYSYEKRSEPQQQSVDN